MEYRVGSTLAVEPTGGLVGSYQITAPASVNGVVTAIPAIDFVTAAITLNLIGFAVILDVVDPVGIPTGIGTSAGDVRSRSGHGRSENAV